MTLCGMLSVMRRDCGLYLLCLVGGWWLGSNFVAIAAAAAAEQPGSLLDRYLPYLLSEFNLMSM